MFRLVELFRDQLLDFDNGWVEHIDNVLAYLGF